MLIICVTLMSMVAIVTTYVGVNAIRAGVKDVRREAYAAKVYDKAWDNANTNVRRMLAMKR